MTQQKERPRCQTVKAADDEPHITITIGSLAASMLQIDEKGMWPNVETLQSRRRGRSGWSYTIQLPVIDAEHMLDELIGRGNNGSGEGYDQDANAKYGCRRAAEKLAEALGQPPPRWQRPW